MRIKIDGEYLDFDDYVEVDRKIKLFEDISTSDGDISFSFDVQQTSHNLRLLKYPLPDSISKQVYQKIECELLDEQHLPVYTGFLRIESIDPRKTISCSFFSGNSNWFGLLSTQMSVLDLSEFNEEINITNINAAVDRTEGIVYPLVDNGLLYLRGNSTLKVQDYVPAVYVKTLFKKIFTYHSIKTNGELFSDPNFNAMIALSVGDPEQNIKDRSTFARVTNSPTGHASGIPAKVLFSDDSTFPYYDGATDNFSVVTSRYTADVKMTVDAEFIINNLVVATVFGTYTIYYYVNGIEVKAKLIYDPVLFPQPLTFKVSITLNAGDYLEVYVLDDAQIFADPLTDATLKVTPTYLFQTLSQNVIPSMTQGDFVSGILQMFNTLTSFNQYTKTLTINMFDRLKHKTSTDLSRDLTVTKVDYTEFIDGYAKKNLFSFQELSINEEFRFTQITYSKGEIDVNNDFLDEEADVIESDFTNPIGYVNPIFDMHLERTDLITVESVLSVNFTNVEDASDVARFTIESAKDLFVVGDLVRISESSDPRYNGDWVVSAIDLDAIEPGWLEFIGLNFISAATGKAERLEYRYSTDENVFVLHHVPSYTIPKLSGKTDIAVETDTITDTAYAFFNLINTGRQINTDYKQSLSFAQGDNGYQTPLIDQYFVEFKRVLNDPVKIFADMYASGSLYRRLDLLHPISITTAESTNLYYINMIRGYQSSYLPAIVELIKLP
jgi:hypothetical protein